jgi:hypothetical protein
VLTNPLPLEGSNWGSVSSSATSRRLHAKTADGGVQSGDAGILSTLG